MHLLNSGERLAKRVITRDAIGMSSGGVGGDDGSLYIFIQQLCVGYGTPT